MTERARFEPARKWIEFGRLGAPHGVAGEIRFFPHNPASPILDEVPRDILLHHEDSENVRPTVLRGIRKGSKAYIARLEGVASREDAAALTNARVYILREEIPPLKAHDEFHAFELEGLEVRDAGGAVCGRVEHVADFGAGTILVLHRRKGQLLVPLAEPWIGDIRPDEGYLVADLSEWDAL